MAFLETWLHMLACRIRHELYWLANGILEEIGYLCSQIELGMSYVTGYWHF